MYNKAYVEGRMVFAGWRGEGEGSIKVKLKHDEPWPDDLIASLGDGDSYVTTKNAFVARMTCYAKAAHMAQDEHPALVVDVVVSKEKWSGKDMHGEVQPFYEFEAVINLGRMTSEKCIEVMRFFMMWPKLLFWRVEKLQMTMSEYMGREEQTPAARVREAVAKMGANVELTFSSNLPHDPETGEVIERTPREDLRELLSRVLPEQDVPEMGVLEAWSVATMKEVATWAKKETDGESAHMPDILERAIAAKLDRDTRESDAEPAIVDAPQERCRPDKPERPRQMLDAEPPGNVISLADHKDRWTVEKLSLMPRARLREVAKEHGVGSGGTKPELIARMVAFDVSRRNAEKSETAS